MTDDWDLPLVTSLRYSLFLPPLVFPLNLASSLIFHCFYSSLFSLTLTPPSSLSHPFSPYPSLFQLSPLSLSFFLDISLPPSPLSSVSYYRLILWKCSFLKRLITEECGHQQWGKLIKGLGGRSEILECSP